MLFLGSKQICPDFCKLDLLVVMMSLRTVQIALENLTVVIDKCSCPIAPMRAVI